MHLNKGQSCSSPCYSMQLCYMLWWWAGERKYLTFVLTAGKPTGCPCVSLDIHQPFSGICLREKEWGNFEKRGKDLVCTTATRSTPYLPTSGSSPNMLHNSSSPPPNSTLYLLTCFAPVARKQCSICHRQPIYNNRTMSHCHQSIGIGPSFMFTPAPFILSSFLLCLHSLPLSSSHRQIYNWLLIVIRVL